MNFYHSVGHISPIFIQFASGFVHSKHIDVRIARRNTVSHFVSSTKIYIINITYDLGMKSAENEWPMKIIFHVYYSTVD